MKQVILVVVAMMFLLVFSAGCSSPTTTWVWDEERSVGVRVGKFLSENNEVGGSVKWRDEDSGPRILGIYAVHHFPDKVEFRNPLIVDFLRETLFGTAYLGGKFDYNTDTHDGDVDPIAGIIFEDTLFIEHSLNGNSMLGLRFKF